MRSWIRPIAVATVLIGSPAVAAGPAPLRSDAAVDGTIAGVSIFGWLLTETALKDTLAPQSCRLCGTATDAQGNVHDTVNVVDRTLRNWLVWRDADGRSRAGLLSHVVAFGVLPAAVVGHDAWAAHSAGEGGAVWLDLLVMAEAVGLSADLNQAAKFLVARERPSFRVPAPAGGTGDDNLSFYSGHASFAFALTSAAGTVAMLRGYRHYPWIYGVGFTLAATTGYLRIAADRHYFTDVVAGAVAGGAIGFAVPWFFHRAGGNSRLAVLPSAGGVTLMF